MTGEFEQRKILICWDFPESSPARPYEKYGFREKQGGKIKSFKLFSLR